MRQKAESEFNSSLHHLVAEFGCWTCDQHVAGSNPGRRLVKCNSGQVVNSLHMLLSPSSIFGTSQRVVTPCGWEDNHRSGDALAMRHIH